ncbi:MAG: hypothetical protein ACNS63_09510 [Candidatus Nitrospinota bacterium M3_3B_026]
MAKTKPSHCPTRGVHGIPSATALLMVGILILGFLGAAHAQSGDSEKLGQEAGYRALESFGTLDGLRDNLISPMIGGDELPVQGGETVEISIPCPATTNFLDVTVGPAGSGGDISNIHFRQDTDLDGSIDHSSYLDVQRVSGVCADGVISCEAGTWANCNFYRWNAGTSGQIALEPLSKNELKECYCVNNSCAAGVVSERLLSITRDLGAGMIDAIHGANPHIAISESNISAGHAVYSARNMADASCESATDQATGDLYINVESSVGSVDSIKAQTNDFETGRTRMENISSNLSANVDFSSVTLYYQDEYGSHNTALEPSEAYGSFPECVEVCKVRKSLNDTQASRDGHTALFRYDVTEVDYILKKCDEGVCPLEASEDILADCSCLNEFNTAFTSMALLEGAARTVICSSGVRK